MDRRQAGGSCVMKENKGMMSILEMLIDYDAFCRHSCTTANFILMLANSL
jgi:hypothetical protein